MIGKNDTLSAEEQNVINKLKEMHLSGMADAFKKQVTDPNADLDSFMDRITRIVETEWTQRYDKKFNRLLKQAKLRYPHADFDETLYEQDRKLDYESIQKLATCEWVDEGRNLLITGMTSSGKTYLSNALCVSALRRLKTVKYIKASHLMMELEQARIKDTYMDVLTSLNTKTDLLAIDDFGLMELDIDKCRDLFEVIDGRDGRRSTIIISQYPVKTWFDMFKDGTYADACLSRLTDRSHTYRLEMNGRSMRDPV